MDFIKLLEKPITIKATLGGIILTIIFTIIAMPLFSQIPQIDYSEEDVWLIFDTSDDNRAVSGIRYTVKVTLDDDRFYKFSPMLSKNGSATACIKRGRGKVKKVEFFLLDEALPFKTKNIRRTISPDILIPVNLTNV